MSSTPGDYNRVELIGTVERVLPRGETTACLLRVHDGAGPPCHLVVWPPEGVVMDLAPEMRLHVRGTLRVEEVPGRRSLHYLQAEYLEVVRPLKRVPA
jgi:hypothetical protein